MRGRLQERDDQLLLHGQRKQPLVVVVGENLTELTHHIPVIDSFTYNLPNLTVAIDACFKAFFALNALYPKECEQVWLIIQRCVYGIRTQYDNESISNASLCLEKLKAY